MKIKDAFDLDLDILIRWMRESGVEELHYMNRSLVLSKTLPPLSPVENSNFEDEGEKEKLPCGHQSWEANEIGECLHGCEPTTKEE